MKRFVLLLAGVLLTGCLTTGKRGGDNAMAVYDFGPQAVALVGPRSAPVALEVQAPLWLDTAGIQYRLSYQDAARLREYTLARWAAPLPQLLRQGLQQRLALVPVGQVRSRCVLRVELQEFSQEFNSPAASAVRLQARLHWLDARRSAVASRDLALTAAAPTADAQGGVQGFLTVFGQLTAAIRDWEAELARSGKKPDC